MRWKVKNKIIGGGRGAPEEEIPNGRVTGWFGALFARLMRV